MICEITKVDFYVYNELDEIIIMDAIQIFTRKVYPITNLEWDVDGSYYYDLSWGGD